MEEKEEIILHQAQKQVDDEGYREDYPPTPEEEDDRNDDDDREMSEEEAQKAALYRWAKENHKYCGDKTKV